MNDIREIYKKERITVEEVNAIANPRERTAIILDWDEGKRKFEGKEFSFVKLLVQFKQRNRTIHLSYNNAEEIAKVKGVDPDNWKNTAIQLNAIPDERGFRRMQVFVSSMQV